MKIMLKHTLKNIAAKPLRAILLFVCIGVCSFTAFLCLDMSKTIENLVKYMFMQVTGTADIVMTDSMGLEEGMLQTEEASVGLRVASRQSGTIEVPEGFVSFFHTKHFEVKTMDFERAYQMRLLGEKLSLSKDQAAISKKLSKEYGLKKGDTIALYDDTGKEESYHVVKVLSESGMVNGVQTVLLGEEGYQKLLYGGEMLYDTAYIDVLDDSFSGQVAEELEKKDFRADVKVLFDEGEMKNMIRMITMVFLLMFAVCFLLVIFVTVSVSGRVISERMPVVGTFRSLGISNTLTTSFLLLESGIYGLLGGALGCLLYRFFRNLIFSKIVSVDAGDVSVSVAYGRIPFLVYLVVLFGAVAVEMICSLKEVIRASRTSIRDIIFDNKDTKYKKSSISMLIGILLFLTAVLFLFLPENAGSLFFCFAAIIFSLSLLFPCLLALGSKLFCAIFKKTERPVAKMAAMEVYGRKSTVGSSVLCVTAATLALILFIFVTSLERIYDIQMYDCDLILSVEGNQKEAMFSYIKDLDGVRDTEEIYMREQTVGVNGEKQTLNLFGQPEEGFRYLIGMKGLPEKISENEFFMDKGLADKMKLKKGEKAEILLDAESYLPVKKSLTLAGYVDSYEIDTSSKSIVISKKLYIDIFHDYPGQILIRASSGDSSVRSQIVKYSGTMMSSLQTNEEYQAD
ncbi:MAG: hypothetical protein IJ733_01565, partial [Lachnospiraceae bacterium]|nr:hypothetical protein [Lachnospiraceae bacterium]